MKADKARGEGEERDTQSKRSQTVTFCLVCRVFVLVGSQREVLVFGGWNGRHGRRMGWWSGERLKVMGDETLIK